MLFNFASAVTIRTMQLHQRRLPQEWMTFHKTKVHVNWRENFTTMSVQDGLRCLATVRQLMPLLQRSWAVFSSPEGSLEPHSDGSKFPIREVESLCGFQYITGITPEIPIWESKKKLLTKRGMRKICHKRCRLTYQGFSFSFLIICFLLDFSESIRRKVGKISLWFFSFQCVNLRGLVAPLGEMEWG